MAQNPSHPAHILPPPLPARSRVLDVGCGAGQTLIAAYPEQFCVGVDVDSDALVLGRIWSNTIQFACAQAEALPFRNNEFDCVMARVSLAYTDLARSLPEIARVLKPSGLFWAVLHPAAIPLATARAGGIKAWVFFAYIACNSFLFHLLGRNFRFGNRCESFQTGGGMQRALRSHGFTNVEISHGRHFVVQARRA